MATHVIMYPPLAANSSTQTMRSKEGKDADMGCGEHRVRERVREREIDREDKK